MIKRIVNSNAVWAILAVAFNSSINFLIVPYVSENVGVEAYGFVTLANAVITYVDVISIAFNSFASRYIAIEYHKGNYEKASKYYTSIFVANLFLVFCLIVLCVIAIPNLDVLINISSGLDRDVKILFGIVFARYSLVLLRTAFDVSTFIKNRLDLTEKFRVLSYIVQASVLLVVCSTLDARVWYVGLATFIATLVLLVAQYITTNKITPELKINFSFFSFKYIKDFLVAGIWNSINNIGNLLNSGLDLLITNRMLTELLMGMVSVSKTLGSLSYTLVIAVSSSFRPKQLESYSKGDLSELVNRLKSSMKITGSICAIVIAGFYVCGSEFLALWLPGQDTDTIFRISMIVLLSDVMVGVVNPLYFVFTLTKKLKIPCLITITMGILNVVSMYVLIRNTSLGAYAVVLTTMVLNFIHFIDTPIYSAYCLKLPLKTFYAPIINHLVNCLFNVLIMSLIGALLPVATNWLLLLFKVIILALFGVLVSSIMITTMNQKRNIFNRVKFMLFK